MAVGAGTARRSGDRQQRSWGSSDGTRIWAGAVAEQLGGAGLMAVYGGGEDAAPSKWTWEGDRNGLFGGTAGQSFLVSMIGATTMKREHGLLGCVDLELVMVLNWW
ncbi:hypothetical protein M0R45_031031 [Rubus argutus]|uniref:Uncharacterized protein n=1 Tax=Rubus argutus TaxID=59490 RepID=A0AAW1WEZ4_RUBAR